ncbi:hypothetical protein HBI56_151660 [Parastagonospora nodorum]|uniref:Uncharacterized protein n=1 Tax=Phaeosphaeria nodorum (strain SN15 / ATCC MYA-4574 / FGSC 10173) TaxID=321614 RepID=A0A7U2I6Y6_PHANO|nr:hypothetical protein HBH56_182850 [Parastagonospora nodorum]QRD04175.1 hypothetical protein JI435_420820 [Parastagonospora nodorum SN15]KAH3926208.1 hypothetical protein HBH54_172000 [Parastagonospora nodorum]KAH3944725.1 hypothetical protein HBH53_152910 [Parastagonospora nodorum]KAH3962471.1 hypothetical protein HBH52_223500 [Parastagonospora nodorum]
MADGSSAMQVGVPWVVAWWTRRVVGMIADVGAVTGGSLDRSLLPDWQLEGAAVNCAGVARDGRSDRGVPKSWSTVVVEGARANVEGGGCRGSLGASERG